MTITDRPVISIIIPALNESENLHTCLSSLPYQDMVEVILSDGGSIDDTLAIAQQFPIVILHADRGRARQMNAAARCARGDVLLFLHADTILPPNAYHELIRSIQDGCLMGCFERKFDTSSRLLAVTSRWAGWRARKLFWAYGDQAIFINHALFRRLGGYRDLRRFEDLDLAIRAKPHGRWTVLPEPVVTDARRFGKHPLPRLASDFFLTLAWRAGLIDQ
ncbi:MAG: TIGR04283 family arsenosugar biosynthesis glycosyltransferase [Akkermansiaceae bacterium]|nr:TIGR04283 family arsenosugar biosynthesis glycosyltransferase [Akkermansiaceae bacterium]